MVTDGLSGLGAAAQFWAIMFSPGKSSALEPFRSVHTSTSKAYATGASRYRANRRPLYRHIGNRNQIAILALAQVLQFLEKLDILR
jgi:hypothetical protein